jgi:hypothetical protein
VEAKVEDTESAGLPLSSASLQLSVPPPPAIPELSLNVLNKNFLAYHSGVRWIACTNCIGVSDGKKTHLSRIPICPKPATVRSGRKRKYDEDKIMANEKATNVDDHDPRKIPNVWQGAAWLT